jgi:hypothetical protein
MKPADRVALLKISPIARQACVPRKIGTLFFAPAFLSTGFIATKTADNESVRYFFSGRPSPQALDPAIYPLSPKAGLTRLTRCAASPERGQNEANPHSVV